MLTSPAPSYVPLACDGAPRPPLPSASLRRQPRALVAPVVLPSADDAQQQLRPRYCCWSRPCYSQWLAWRSACRQATMTASSKPESQCRLLVDGAGDALRLGAGARPPRLPPLVRASGVADGAARHGRQRSVSRTSSRKPTARPMASWSCWSSARETRCQAPCRARHEPDAVDAPPRAAYALAQRAALPLRGDGGARLVAARVLVAVAPAPHALDVHGLGVLDVHGLVG